MSNSVKAAGACNCGAVAFEILSDITDVFVCHCSICRKATGTNGIAVVVFNSSDFRWLRGEDQFQRWRKPGHDWEMSFCRTCGSPLPGADDDTQVFVPAGLITQGGEQLTVKHHIWVGSKAVWDEIGDSGKQHPEGFLGER